MSDENNLLHHDHQQQGPLCPTRSVAKDDRAMFWRRVRSFATTLYVLTGAGVIYLFSSYATQLRDRLGYSQLQVAQLASTGNLGLYLGGPPVGFLIDRFGPRPVAVTGTVLMFFAFAAIAQGYASGTAPIGAMVLAYGILGLGSASGTLSSIALNVKSFPANVRGFAVGVPVSFYGLSAFLFVQVKQHLFAATPEGITGFLRFITAFLGLGIVVAVFGMFEVPMMASSEIGGSARRLEESLVADDENDDASSSSSSSSSSGIEDVDDSGTVTDASIVMYLKRSRSWALIAIFFLGAGTGLMVIGNIGAVVLSLFPPGSTSAEPIVQAAQAKQVAILSIFNAAGRVVAGIGSDATGGAASRPWWAASSMLAMTLASALVALGGVSAGHGGGWVLTATTAAIGYSYGTLWSLCPSIVSGWVTPARFGLIWGAMTCVPALSQQVTNTLFGAVYDAHLDHSGPVTECRGIDCFASAYGVTSIMCAIGTVSALALAMGKFDLVAFQTIPQQQQQQEEVGERSPLLEVR